MRVSEVRCRGLWFFASRQIDSCAFFFFRLSLSRLARETVSAGDGWFRRGGLKGDRVWLWFSSAVVVLLVVVGWSDVGKLQTAVGYRSTCSEVHV